MKPRLLLHICCAPCATVVLNRLRSDYELTGFFYNPNIFPEEEYQKRLLGVEILMQRWQFGLVVGKYDHQRFLAAVEKLEGEPEGGGRCEICYQLRLSQTVAKAREMGFGFVASTLTVGPNKKAELINRIGSNLASTSGVEFLVADWKKRNGFKESVEISRSLGLYRQQYCGCEFSLSRLPGAYSRAMTEGEKVERSRK